MALREQQTVIANMLQHFALLSSSRPMTKELWTRIFKATGLCEEMMRKWHIQFEKTSPDEDLAFFQFSQICEEEVKNIRRRDT